MNPIKIKAFALALVLAIGCTACSRQDDAEIIRARIADGAKLAEAHDIKGLLALTTAEVRAEPTDLDRRGIRAALWRTFAYYGPLKLLYPRPEIDVDKDAGRASSRFPFLIVKKEQVFPDLDALRDNPAAWLDAIGAAADLYRFSLTWALVHGTWQVSHVRLERFTGMRFD